jgi:hypothetical protein
MHASAIQGVPGVNIPPWRTGYCSGLPGPPASLPTLISQSTGAKDHERVLDLAWTEKKINTDFEKDTLSFW